MSAFFTFIGEVLGLNISWLINFFLSNLFWLFAMSMLVHIFFGFKNYAKGMVFLTFALWLWGDFEALSGIGFMGAQVLLIYYLSKISLLAIVESSPGLKKHMLVISTITGLVALVAANVLY